MGENALITEITGHDGACLAEYPIKKGYTIQVVKCRNPPLNTDMIDHLYQNPHELIRNLILNYGDLSDSINNTMIFQEFQPDEIYNLGSMSHVKVSFDVPEYTANTDCIGTLRILETIRLLGLKVKTKIYQTSNGIHFYHESPICGETFVSQGDESKARTRPGWEPRYNLDALILVMVQSDLTLALKEKYLKEECHKTLNHFE